MKVNTDYLKEVLSVTEQATGCEVSICGGYLRDLDHGIESKDLGVFVLAQGAEDICHTVLEPLDLFLQAEGLVANKFEDNKGLPTRSPQVFFNSASGSNMRDDVIGVKKYYCSDLDFVFMSATDWPQITKNFDVSICQIVCRLEEGKLNIYASDSYMAYKKGEGEILRFYPVPTCDSHVARIKAKFGKVTGVYTTDDTLNLVGELTEDGIIYDEQ